MNTILATTIICIMAITLLTFGIANPVVASVDENEKDVDPDEVFGDEEECAKKYNPYYDRERYLGCTGGIGTPSIK